MIRVRHEVTNQHPERATQDLKHNNKEWHCLAGLVQVKELKTMLCAGDLRDNRGGPDRGARVAQRTVEECKLVKLNQP